MAGSYSRRDAMRLVGLAGSLGAGGALAACTTTATRPVTPPVGVPPALLSADFSRVPDGPMPPVGGQAWTAVASGDAPAVHLGAIGPPAGHVPGSAPGGTAAGYAQLQLPGPCRRVGGMLRWDATPADDNSVALGAFDTVGFRPESTSSSMHLVVKPELCEFAVFSGGYGDFTKLAPEGASGTSVAFDEPLECDGRTLYRCECVIDAAASTATVTIADRFVGTYRDPRIAAVRAVHPFWEYFTETGKRNIGRFTSVWTDVR